MPPRPTRRRGRGRHRAHSGRGGRPLEELFDPTGEVRQAVWAARIALLRRIDPDNPQLTYFANPNSPPRQDALNRLDAAIETASIKRVADKIMPHGRWIGRAGGGEDVRELSGGTEAAAQLFDYLTVGGGLYRSEPNLTIVKLPGKAGFITYRPRTASGSPALDINVPPIPLMKFHFTGGK